MERTQEVFAEASCVVCAEDLDLDDTARDKGASVLALPPAVAAPDALRAPGLPVN